MRSNARFLRKFCILNDLVDADFTASGVYRPFDLYTSVEQLFTGITIPSTKINDVNRTLGALLNNPALSQPLIYDKAHLSNCHQHRILPNCQDIPEISTTRDFNLVTCPQITMISKDSYLKSRDCIILVEACAKIFRLSKNLSHIMPIGDVSSLVVSTIRIKTQPRVPVSTPRWYPRISIELEAKLQLANPLLEIKQQRIPMIILLIAVLL